MRSAKRLWPARTIPSAYLCQKLWQVVIDIIANARLSEVLDAWIFAVQLWGFGDLYRESVPGLWFKLEKK